MTSVVRSRTSGSDEMVQLETHQGHSQVSEYLCPTVERAASKIAVMVALVAHKVGAQCSGGLVLGRNEAHVTGALVHVEEGRP
eukprot:1959650-Pleurochrysis_carterae.AAC.1